MTYYGRRPQIINKYFYGRAQPYGCFCPCEIPQTPYNFAIQSFDFPHCLALAGNA